MAGLQNVKTPRELPSMSATPSDSHHDQETDSALTEERDRSLRNRIILANAAAWVAIGLVFSYFFL
ncbi:MAG: hypothetical protein K2W78_01905 [Xanthobacteraceae bacterium]|nr:hypothetical protein [Xanthobacteraceae bacterium]